MIKKLKQRFNNKSANSKDLIIGSSTTFLITIAGMISGYILTLFISRIYGAEGIGIFNLSYNIMSFIGMFCMMGMNISVLRFVGEYMKKKEVQKLPILYIQILKMILPLTLLFSIILYSYSSFIANELLKNNTYENAIKIIAIVLPFFVLLEISIELIRGTNKLMISETLRSLTRPVLNTFFLLIAGYYLTDLFLPLYGLGISIIISSIFGVFYIIKNFDFFNISQTSILKKKEIFRISLPMMGTSIISFFIASISLYTLQFYSTTANVGIFSVCLKISLIVGLVLTVTNTVMAPKFAGLYWSDEKNELQELVDKTNKLNTYLSGLLTLIMIGLSHYILLVFGEDFSNGKNVLIILCVAQFFNVATGSAGVMLNMCGFQKEARNIIFYSLIVSVLLHFILVPFYNLTGAAIAFFLTTIFFRICNVYTAKKLLNINCLYIPLISRKA